MKLNIKPKAFHPQPFRDTANLWFADDKQGEFYLHGGLCWPVSVGDIENQYGCIILGGLNTETGVASIFEQFCFEGIESAFDQDEGRIKSDGLASFLGLVHGAYGNKRYYVNQEESVHRMYLLQALRSRQIDPKPVLVPIEWKSDEEAMSAMNHWRVTGNLAIASNTPIEDAFRRFRAAPGTPLRQIPELHALACFLVGLTLRPWRRHTSPHAGFRS